MTRLESEPDVKALAADLGMPAKADPVRWVIDHCLARVNSWCPSSAPITDIGKLEKVVSRNLQVVLEEAWTDEGLDEIIERYVELGEGVFRFLKHDLDSGTFGVTVRRKNASLDALDRYVAVIDCRGDKAARRFFTRWHEIAHLLVLTQDLEAPVRRASDSPLERLMDEIAGQVGFYQPIFDPAFAAFVPKGEPITFAAIDEIRKGHFPDASFQATLFAAMRHSERAVVYVEAALGYKAEEARAVKRSEQWLFDDAQPTPKLRAVQVVPNVAALAFGFFIPPNMRIPETSIIHRLFVGVDEQDLTGTENLESWEHSKGKRLKNRSVWIECRKVRDRVFATVQEQ
jgi:hypothetical protein